MTESHELGLLLLDRLGSISGDLTKQTYQPAEILVAEGQANDSVFVLISGALEVTKSIDGQDAVLADLTAPGTVVGEMVAMGGGTRTATVSAKAQSELYALDVSTFQSLVATDHDLAVRLSSLAVRRAEEGELAEMLVGRFKLADPARVASACASVAWLTLEAGETLYETGDRSNAVYFVVRGRLRVEGSDHPGGAVTFAKGDIIGDLGLLTDRPRQETVTALRHAVVAVMDDALFFEFVDDQPRLMADLALAAVSRYVETTPRSSPATVLAVVAPTIDRERIIGGLLDELSRHGTVASLSSERVDSLLGTSGIAMTEPGEVGDVRVARLVHEFEMEFDHLVVDIGIEDGPWARRALGIADRIIVATRERPTSEQIELIDHVLASCQPGIPRTLLIEHSGDTPPSGTAEILGDLLCGDALHVQSGSAGDMARAARVVTGRAAALVIGGGGARGFAHIGAFRAIEELGITIDLIAGTSIGGVFGTLIADGNSPENLLTMAEKFASVLDYTLPVVSLIKGQKIARLARDYFGDRHIEDLRKTFLCVSTDLTVSRPHLHARGALVTAIRATSAIPGVMPPVPVEQALLVDGGVLNNLPIDVARSASPVGEVIAFDVAPPRGPGAHGDYGLAVSGWKALRSRGAGEKSPYPRISAVLMRSMITASMRERDRQVATGLADFYLNLDMRGVSMLDFSDPGAVAARGYEDSMPALEAWLAGRQGSEPARLP